MVSCWVLLEIMVKGWWLERLWNGRLMLVRMDDKGLCRYSGNVLESMG